MKAIGVLVIGILATLFGLLWMAQGAGYVRWPASSGMIDQSIWIYVGAAVAIGGLVVIFVSRRMGTGRRTA
jgi:hypothetical protein